MIYKICKLIIFFGLIVFAISCNNNTKYIKPNNDSFKKLELKRGKLLLCGDPNFGQVDFSLSCRYDLRDKFNLGLTL